jgi:hypothetical protein
LQGVPIKISYQFGASVSWIRKGLNRIYPTVGYPQKQTILCASFEYISDQAEFTPRNVQTVESRSTTVYAIKIGIPNPDHVLKPGIPADASF